MQISNMQPFEASASRASHCTVGLSTFSKLEECNHLSDFTAFKDAGPYQACLLHNH